MKGNLIITSGENEGKLNATFDYIMPDTLVIQFRDVLGRKQALMSLAGENFELWMQRENRKLGREEIPDEFSLFVLKTLKLDQIRQLFLGLPLVSRDSSQAVTTFLGPSGLPERVEIFNAPGELSTLFIYSEFSLEKDIFLPSALQILDLNKGVDLKIKFYHFSMEYFNLSSHKKRGEIE
ncbi:MAG: hypothetical protein JXQ65_15055 [Candidatus Marinimicrobia bacterium]|nr:hypothetical protein [Candidatus Neomarinimicrobiota bacterium]